jgi:NADH-quinone oxidoreductase subunit B
MLKILDFFNYSKSQSPWMVHFCSGCCSLEMAAAMGPRYDWERYGYISAPTPRQSDVLIITGLVSKKILPALLRTYAQMPEPKYVLAIGACAYDGGPYNDSVSVIKNMTEILPADAFVAGCPPKPEAIISGLEIIKEKLRKNQPSEASKGGLWKQMKF